MIRRKNQKNEQGLAREKLLFQYTMALERGDFPALEAILNQAETDAVLEQMIAEINVALAEELPMPKSSTVPLKFGSNHATHNHRHNGIYQTEDRNNPMSITTLPKPYARLESTQRRFPFALAAAVLAVILIGGLLATVQFGLNDDGRSTGGGLQNETATLPSSATPIVPSPTRVDDDGSPSSATPIPNDGQGIVPSPTLSDGGLQISATPLATLLPTQTYVPMPGDTYGFGTRYVYVPTLCEGYVQVADGIMLFTKPGLSSLTIAYLPDLTEVNILDVAYWPDILTGAAQTGGQIFYFVESVNLSEHVIGWTYDSALFLSGPCPAPEEVDEFRLNLSVEWAATQQPGATVIPPDATGTMSAIGTAVSATQSSLVTAIASTREAEEVISDQMATAENDYYSDLSTAVAGTVEAMIPPTVPAVDSSVRRENVVVTDAQITMTGSPTQVHLMVTGYHPDACQYGTVLNQRQNENHITVEIYREIPRGVGCLDMIVDYQATLSLGIFAQGGGYTVDINGYPVEFVVQAPTATFTPAPQTQSNALPRTGDCVLATMGSNPVNVRFAPTTNSTIIGTIFPDLLYEVVGRSADSSWWQINPEIPGGAVSGWVSASVTRLGGDCSNVAVTDTSTATTPTAPALPPESTFFAPPTVIFPPPTLVSPTPLPTGLISPTYCADC